MWDIAEFSDEEIETLVDVQREFGQYTGSKLVDITHFAGSPWCQAHGRGERIIDREDIKRYFIAHPVSRVELGENIEVVSELPSDWYDPSEDDEWRSYLEYMSEVERIYC